MVVKTGECYSMEEVGLVLCESFLNTETGEVTTITTIVEQAV